MSFGFPSRRRPSLFGRGGGSAFKIRLAIAGVLVLVTLIGYFAKTNTNPITGEAQRVGMSKEEEIAVGLQAAPEMIRQFRGLHQDQQAQQRVNRIGNQLVQALNKNLTQQGLQNPYQFNFHLLADDSTINAFALPGGQVFITYALYRELTDGQLAGVLGHEIGHVLERHGAQHMAQQQLTQGLAGAAGVAGGDANSARLAQMVGSLITMKYGREDELESDHWGVRLTALAGYDPQAMIGVMDILQKASGGGGPPAIFSTHPPPADRREKIAGYIEQEFPNGLPAGLIP